MAWFSCVTRSISRCLRVVFRLHNQLFVRNISLLLVCNLSNYSFVQVSQSAITCSNGGFTFRIINNSHPPAHLPAFQYCIYTGLCSFFLNVHKASGREVARRKAITTLNTFYACSRLCCPFFPLLSWCVPSSPEGSCCLSGQLLSCLPPSASSSAWGASACRSPVACCQS